MENLRLENEEGKKATVSQLAKLEEAMKARDREMEKLDEQVANKKQSGRSQDEEVKVFKPPLVEYNDSVHIGLELAIDPPPPQGEFCTL